jgi:uncharacterized protein YdbL (DUF1318 family)
MNHLKTIICALVLGTLTCSPLAWAGAYDIKEMTPEIQQSLSGRQARYGQLKQLKSSGAIGENNEGYVEALSGPGNSVASAENADRRVIYSAIVQQNNLGGSGLAQVQKVFAEVQRDKATAGESIQLASGEWTKK